MFCGWTGGCGEIDICRCIVDCSGMVGACCIGSELCEDMPGCGGIEFCDGMLGSIGAGMGGPVGAPGTLAPGCCSSGCGCIGGIWLEGGSGKDICCTCGTMLLVVGCIAGFVVVVGCGAETCCTLGGSSITSLVFEPRRSDIHKCK